MFKKQMTQSFKHTHFNPYFHRIPLSGYVPVRTNLLFLKCLLVGKIQLFNTILYERLFLKWL